LLLAASGTGSIGGCSLGAAAVDTLLPPTPGKTVAVGPTTFSLANGFVAGGGIEEADKFLSAEEWAVAKLLQLLEAECVTTFRSFAVLSPLNAASESGPPTFPRSPVLLLLDCSWDPAFLSDATAPSKQGAGIGSIGLGPNSEELALVALTRPLISTLRTFSDSIRICS